METLFVCVTLLAAVSAKSLPDADYVLTKEDLARVFGSHMPVKTSAAEAPFLVPNESVNIKPHQKKNEIFKTVELNIKIKVNDFDKKGADKTAKQNPEKSDPDIHTRFVEDDSLTGERDNFDVKECASIKLRFNDKCVIPEPEEHM